MPESLKEIEVISLFVEDLGAAKDFYQRIFEVEEVYGDDACSVLKFQNLAINLLKSENAPELIEPMKPGAANSGPRMIFTILVKDVDAVCARFKGQGVALLNGPMDRPWGRRTAAFADPAGHCWEIAQAL